MQRLQQGVPMRTRLTLVPFAMFLALASLAFNVVTQAPTAGEGGPDPDSGGIDSGSLDGGSFDSFAPDTSTVCSGDMDQDVCAPSGSPGCAGGGGAGGSGGQGGAASVALIAIGSTTVTVTNGAFVVAHGGTGGPGGGGQSGGGGEAGTQGASYACKGACPSCNVTQTLAGGTPGSGTSGGLGGQGGGGAGGPAYDYVEVSGATVTVTPSTLDASVTGLPGTGGQPNGITGGAGVHP
jgi:hypothetical protein